MQKVRLFGMRKQGKESGFTLLEYCAGASVLIVIVYAAITAMGTGLSNFLRSVGNWATARAAEVK